MPTNIRLGHAAQHGGLRPTWEALFDLGRRVRTTLNRSKEWPFHGAWRAFAICFALGSLAFFLTGCEPQGQKALLEGERLLQEERYNEAIRMLEIATAKLPREARAWNLLGLAYHGGGLSTEASQAYQKALALDHRLSAARFNLGSLLLEQDQAQLAISELTAFTLLQPKAVNGWLRLGAAQMRLSRFDAADTSYRTALGIVPKQPEALNGLGVIQINRRRYIDAIQYFQAALAESPNYPQALLNQAIVTHRYLGQRGTALQKYRQYLAIQPRPDNWESVSVVAQALADEIAGTARPTSTTSQAATPASGRPQTSTAAPPALVNVRPGQIASVTTPTSVPTLPSNASRTLPTPTPSPKEPKGVASTPVPILPLSVAPPPPAAQPAPSVPTPSLPAPKPATPAAAPVDQDVPPAVVVSAVPPPLAVKPPQELISPRPSPANPSIAANPGAVRRPVATPSATADSAAQAQEKRGFFQRLNPFRKSAKPEPVSPPAVVTAIPPRPVAPSLREEAVARANVPTTADSLPSRDFKRYSYRRPGVATGGDRQKASELVNKGILAHRDRRPEEELAFYRSAVLSDPANFDAHFNLGLASAEQGDLNTALDAYEHALGIAPDSAACRYNFALALRQSDYPVDAAKELETILQTYPNDAKVLLALGNLYAQKLKQPQIARGYYLRMLEADPNHPRASDVRFWLSSNP